MDGMIWALVAFAFAQLADVATTVRALRRGGREANPLIAWAMRHLGALGWIAFKLAFAGVIAWMLVVYDQPVALGIAAGLTFAAAAWNTRRARK